ncbi:MAG TPA: serine/threonine-protein kinase, partial [Xanthomonadales bacterium]|nr:serine/threonine-protein kinase [Xanthomonadales bacterium]
MTVTARERLQRLEALFHAALALPPAERDTYLLAECGTDDALRVEVQALLAADSQDAPHDVAGSIGRIAHAVSTENAAPARRIGAWRLEKPIGAGGMGTVHLAARADGAFEGRAALKLLNPWLVGSGFEERFARERQFLADLKHPNIAGLLDGGITDDGVPYLVVEYIDGQSVSAWAAEQKPDLRRRIGLFIEICEAVQHAHQNLVVHRDLKPGNILVGRDNHAKLLDFGIAKLVPTAVGAEAGATREGSRLMTPEYASPEQLRGESATTASDVYSLGLILYELVAGGRPMRPPDSAHDTALPTRPSTWIARTRDPIELPVPAGERRKWGQDSRARRRRWARNLRGDLDTIVLKALAFDPARRYQTARELADDLRRFRAHEPVHARPDSWAYRFGLLLRRRPFASALATAFIVAIIGSAIGFAALSVRLRAERDRAAELQARAEQAAKTAERTSAFLASLFQSSDPRNRGGGLTGRELLDQGAKRLETELADEPDTLSYLSFVIGGIQRQLGLLDEAEKSLRRSVDLRTKRFGRNSKETADSLSELADTLRMQSKWEESEALQRESLAIREKLDPPDPKGLGQSLNNLALVIKESGRLQESLPLTKRAVEVRRASLGDDDPVTIISLVNLGMLERDLGMY